MRTQNTAKLLAAFLLIPMLMLAHSSKVGAQDLPEGVPTGSTSATVTGFVDGDKFNVDIDGKSEEVLLISADAPELAKDDGLGECYGVESAEHLRKLIPEGTEIFLEKDKTDHDGKDRLLRYVWLPRDGKKAQFIDERMIADGYATFKARDENGARDARLTKAENLAKDEHRGLWQACGGGHDEITPVPKVGTGDNPAPIGTAIEADGRRITINSAYFTDAYGYFAPQQNFVYLVIDVTMTNISDSGKTHDYNELCFAAKDLDNDADFDDSLLNPSDRPLGSGDMLVGDAVNGEVVLEVHQNSQRIRVKYSTGPGCVGGKSIYWLVQR